MKAAIIIPARYASTRLPGKLLQDAGGKPVLQYAWEQAKKAKHAARVIIATDDDRIVEAASGFGAEAVMTDPAHESGSERIAQAARDIDAEIIVNVQGDEPEIDPAQLDRLIDAQAAHDAFASTLVCPFPEGAALDDPSAVKAILGKRIGPPEAVEALYFTRALAPYPRDGAPKRDDYRLHIGVYAFRRDALFAFAAAPPGRLEIVERLEQLRILEMGERILAVEAPSAAPGVDTQSDLEAFRHRLAVKKR